MGKAIASGLLVCLLGCGADGTVATSDDAGSRAPVAEQTATPVDPAPPAPPAPPPAEAPVRPVLGGEQVSVPRGEVLVGSRPGVQGRRPRVEADLVPVEVPAFRIDRLPYPNDPNVPLRTGVGRAEAAALCDAEGKRLCSELEWERACKGDEARAYPGGPEFDVEGCSLDAASCASPLGVLSLGVFGFEWTSSDVSRGLGSERHSAVVRGGRVTDPATAHRCGARHALAPDIAGPNTTFRCCEGPASTTAYPEEPPHRRFRQLAMEDEQIRPILATIPELERFSGDFQLVSDEGVDRALSRGGQQREDVAWNLLSGVLDWSPTVGERAWAFTGRSGDSSLIVVLYPLPDGSFVHAASFVLQGETAPIAIAWDYGSRRDLLWGACWGCTGDSGTITLRDDWRIVITQR